MSRFARLILPGLLLIVLAQCSTMGGQSGAGLSDIEKTWRQAWVYVPGDGEDVDRFKMDDDALDSWSVGQWDLPLVLYMHGCTGLHSGDDKIMRFVARQGFVVIAPDSFARGYRPMQCDPDTRSGGYNLFVYDFRQAEINFALKQLRTVPWLQAGKMILFGASEGGVAAALYRGNAFSARIITHWTCHGGPLVSGLDAPGNEAILSIVQAKDPWYAEGHAKAQSGDCSAFFGDRPHAVSVILEDGERHAVFDSQRAREQIAAFLKEVANGP